MAYAALLSLTHTIEQALHLDHKYLIPDEKQKIRCLLKKVNSLLDFLDNSPQIIIEKEESLESGVMNMAHKAEDIIESHIIKELLPETESKLDESFTTLGQNIEKVMKELVAVTKQVMNLKTDEKRGVQDQQPSRTSVPVQSSVGASAGTSTAVGVDDDFRKIKQLLIGGTSDRQIVSIYGMGGIGKTTVAQKVFNDASVKLHFDYRAWVTVSQEFSVEKILLGLLGDTHMIPSYFTEKQTDKLKENVYKNLKNRRYLVVMDDVWDGKVWDDVKRLLPDDHNGSRIILTTRLKAVASCPEPKPHLHLIDFLNEDSSWKLFCDKVFGKDSCHRDLEEIGRSVVKQCEGLPLAIVVIGGLLSKLTKTQYEWRTVAENLEDLLSNSNDEHYSKIWTLSYYNLPHHLKGCFLYVGVFPEDFDIRSSIVTKLWVAEGLIKPVRSRNLEEVAVDYLQDLTERSLVLVAQRSSLGEVKTCKIHDVLRDFCLREAKRVMFFHVCYGSLNGLPEGKHIRRITIHDVTLNLPSSSIPAQLTRSSFEFHRWLSYHRTEVSYPNFLRILHVNQLVRFSHVVREPVNLRYIFATFQHKSSLQSIYKCQYLQSLILQAPFSIPNLSIYQCHLESEFWKMVQLRHVQSVAAVNLPNPPNEETQQQKSEIVLENLQTLFIVNNFRFTAEVLDRIPNLRKLGIYYGDKIVDWGYYCLNSLDQLRKLEALKCIFNGPSPSFLKNVTFPKSLKKLILVEGEHRWKDMEIVGSLCNLRVLKLRDNAFTGRKWKLKEGNFAQLEFLLLDNVFLVHWIADGTCFQNLQRLVIRNCHHLRKIPSGIGETSNLQSIELRCCSDSLIRSAKEIEEEQRENFGNEFIQLLINQEQFHLFMYCPSRSSFLRNRPFHASLVKITLRNCGLPWENITVLGVLPNLEVLELRKNAFIGPQWQSCEDEFQRLRFLLLQEINLQHWIADAFCFRGLQQLVIKKCKYLLSIPDHFGFTVALGAIQVHDCTASLEESAMEILDDQIECGNKLFDVVIT